MYTKSVGVGQVFATLDTEQAVVEEAIEGGSPFATFVRSRYLLGTAGCSPARAKISSLVPTEVRRGDERTL